MCVHECEQRYLGVPDVDTLVEGAAGQVLAVGAEGHAVDGLLVLGERVDAHASLHVPQAHRRVERGAGGLEKYKEMLLCCPGFVSEAQARMHTTHTHTHAHNTHTQTARQTDRQTDSQTAKQL